jgi:hypothetical protein
VQLTSAIEALEKPSPQAASSELFTGAAKPSMLDR